MVYFFLYLVFQNNKFRIDLGHSYKFDIYLTVQLAFAVANIITLYHSTLFSHVAVEILLILMSLFGHLLKQNQTNSK